MIFNWQREKKHTFVAQGYGQTYKKDTAGEEDETLLSKVGIAEQMTFYKLEIKILLITS